MRTAAILLGLLTLGMSAHAEQAELTLASAPTWEPVELDFGQPLSDITQVQIELSGLGGHQCIHFSSPGVEESVLYPFLVTVDLESGSADYLAPMDEAYSSSLNLVLPEDGTWESLADGVGSIRFSPAHTGPATNNSSITACGYDPFVIDSLTVTVTYGSTVPTAAGSWDALKALYR